MKPAPQTRGLAMALAARMLHATTQQPHRIVWCVDISRDVGEGAEWGTDPSDPLRVCSVCSEPVFEEADGSTNCHEGHKAEAVTPSVWGKHLITMRSWLEWQEQAKGSKTPMALTVRYPHPSHGGLLNITYTVPYRVDLRVLCGYDPPVGVWRIWPMPPGKVDQFGNPVADRPKGDVLPHSFWWSGIPF